MTTHSEVSGRVSAPGRATTADDRLLAALLDGMEAALFAVDTAGRITHWNRKAERMLGWSREQAVGRAGLGGWAVREADAADVMDRLLAALRSPAEDGAGRPFQEFPLVRKDGGRILVRAKTTAVREPDGRPTGVYCAFGEAHAQLDLERNLALSEALLGECGSWATVLLDADLRTVAVNDAAAEALAVTPVDMLGEPLGEFFGAGLDELESGLEQALAGQPPAGPVELWLTLLDDGTHEDGFGEPSSGPSGDARRCLVSGFLRLGAPAGPEPAPLGVAWVFQDVTRARRQARGVARRRFRDEQLSRAARAAAECEDPLEAAVLHLHYALPGFADHALLDTVSPKAATLVRTAESPGAFGAASGARGVAVRYRQGHPALQALERGMAVRATGGVSRSSWAVEHRWPKDAEHALCVVLRSRGRSLGVLTFLRGASRRPFDRADAAYGEDVALRVASAVDLHGPART
ncbi:PAS domain-containing protein [Streptomyces millisiae]|uniref:PAS domain-containing protein n=1 Tax=Streptomyces millisiae TaxID=3075542 RepID=A0ABU2LRZ4_9ACTN|nr:PAS domain-containing protein [Streptomyces sp. DSM 44918]MDT0320365.1 PAS domain-containing protein [Streptomyces sp. DSM 44918]